MKTTTDRGLKLWLVGLLGFQSCAGPSQLASSSSPTPAPPARQQASALTCLAHLEPEGRLISLRVSASMAQEPVERWLVEEGARIRRGQPLVKLSARARLQREVELAQAEVLVARAKLSQVLAGPKLGELRAQGFDVRRIERDRASFLGIQKEVIARAEADLRLQQKEFARYQALYLDGAAPASQLDQKRFALESAQTQVQQARRELERQQSILAAQAAQSRQQYQRIEEVRPTDVALAQAEVDRAERQLERARTLAEESLVRSPQDGVLLRILSRAGEPAGTTGLAQIGQTQRMVAVAEVYDSQIGQVRMGQLAELSGRAFPGQTLHGKVVEIGHTVLKQSVYSGEPGENFDRRVVEVRLRLDEDSSRLAGRLSNLEMEARFH